MNIIKHSLAVLGMIAAPAFAASPVTISIDAGKPGRVISKYVYGQFAEHVGTGVYGGMYVGAKSTIPNTRGWRNDVVGTKVKGAAGKVLTAAAMDAHNTFQNPQVIKPAAFSARAAGGKLSIELPAKAVMVIALEE
ncbi:alpha-L-arabinofuranosidase C-terminal domain-containing protein [Massilia luteola]|uniref:alpha-L-arabinofuranosidase C-terminal domain-containing protein n=1 Tax=Massilia luteola TaxID=3081751 RepID=UPI002ACC1042|nr:alpha-L-arabinofuranosidase C-terminal domain-containing protein [Massilia sp. Gc5]